MIGCKETLECDVLVAGGGTAGMMAAIFAADAGANVILAEKYNTRRSGAGATGNDHFQCYIPEVHGTREHFMELYLHDRPGNGSCKDMDNIDAFVDGSFDMVKVWESWGLQMKPHGYWEMSGHCLPWIQGTHLKYEGVDQKPLFTKQALKRGVKILNRHPITELLTDDDGAICGAVLADLTEEVPQMQPVKCRSVILSTAAGGLISGNAHMGAPSGARGTGDGAAIAYRAGARLVNYGVTGSTNNGNPGNGVGRFLARGGIRTWVGTYTDLYGTPYGPIGQETDFNVLDPAHPCEEPHLVTPPTWRTGDYTQYLPENRMSRAYEEGKTVFMNFSNNSDEDTDYMKWALIHEGQGGTLGTLYDHGFDFDKHMLEFVNARTGGGKCGGLDINGRCETTVKGLFGAGECCGNHLPGLSPAAVQGKIAGENATVYAKTIDRIDINRHPTLLACRDHYSRLLENEVSLATPDWSDALTAIQQTMWDFCGNGAVSEELFEVAEAHLLRIREHMKNMHCGSAHDFMNCLGAENDMQNALVAIACGRERRESRGPLKYIGYPDVDHAYDNAYTAVEKRNGEPCVFPRAYRSDHLPTDSRQVVQNAVDARKCTEKG